MIFMSFIQRFIGSSCKMFVCKSRREELKVLTTPGQLSCVSRRLGHQFVALFSWLLSVAPNLTGIQLLQEAKLCCFPSYYRELSH